MTTDDLDSFLAGSAGRLHNLALSLTGSHADADDLLQVTLEKVSGAWGRRIDEPMAYARKVMLRANISEKRRAHWRRELVTETSDMDVPTSASPTDSDDRIVLVQALAALPRRQREAVVLRYLEDLPLAEVAALMNCSQGNVKRCAFEGLRALRSALTPHHYDPDPAGGTRWRPT